MKRSAIALGVCLAVLLTHATQVIFPPLNRDTIVGTWEALTIEGLVVMVARIEILRDGPSFFAYQIVGSPGVNVFRMIGCEIKDAKISLRFRGQEPDGGGSFDW